MTPISAIIEERYTGTWVADVESVEPFAATFTLGGVVWTGAPGAPPVQEGGRYRTRVLGGAAKLATPLPRKWYQGGGSGNTIVLDIARAAGEASAPALPARLATWQRAPGPAGEALDTVCRTLGGAWWVDRSGVLQAAPARPGGAVDMTGRTRVGSDSDGSIVLSGDSAAGLVPGMTIEGRTIRHIRWTLSPDRLLAEVSFTPVEPEEGGLDYSAQHRASVVTQHADGSLDLIVSGTWTLTRVPWLTGLVGDITINQGDVVTVACWGRDPRAWFAFGLDRKAGGAPAAHVGSSVDCGKLLIYQHATTFVVIPLYFPPGTPTSVIESAKSAALGTGAALLLEANVSGNVTTGVDRIKI